MTDSGEGKERNLKSMELKVKKSMQGIAYQRNKHVASKRKHSRKSEEEKRNTIYCFCHDLETLIFRFQEPL